MSRLHLILLLLLRGVTASFAHDPYEITSVVYLQSNRIELFMEMEFPTGMRIAGLTPSRDLPAETQFSAALPRFNDIAGGFFELTAGNNRVLPLRTNVELGVEDHIRFHVEFATTPYRPLRFVVRGLASEAVQSPYGTTLTVLDMVHRKVLGQTTLFADSPPADFPPPVSESTPLLAQSSLAVVATNRSVSAPPGTNTSPVAPKIQPSGGRWSFVAVAALAGCLGLTAVWWLLTRKKT